MKKIIEARTPRIDSGRELEPSRAARLGQWQSGVQTLAGYAQRKLRLVLTRLPVDANQYAQCIPIVKGGNGYAIR